MIIKEQVTVVCYSCSGKGRLTLYHGEQPCPFCRGTGKVKTKVPPDRAN
jgi:DnaJ-class molecular chaperone